MAKLISWLKAARLRTLPLSISGVLVGTALANYYGINNPLIFISALMTTIGFQVTSNFANDYGDGLKGTDNVNRIGPKRALQSGTLSRLELKRGIIISIVIDFLLVLVTIYLAFGLNNLVYPLAFLVLGGASIWAAISYTVGDKAYGYRGLGDFFVFIFFGLLGVLGTLFLFTKTLTLLAFLPACTIGLLSVGVLNLNNLRDYSSDKESGKNTLIVKMGFTWGKAYHLTLLVLAFTSISIFSIWSFTGWNQFLYLIAFVPIAVHFRTIYRINNADFIDPELKKLAISTFFLAVLIYISCNKFL